MFLRLQSISVRVMAYKKKIHTPKNDPHISAAAVTGWWENANSVYKTIERARMKAGFGGAVFQGRLVAIASETVLCFVASTI